MKRTIWFDMDGTIADLYSVENWLPKLRANDPSPYADAAVMHNMSLLARYLNMVQKLGYTIGIITWLSKDSSESYDQAVAVEKLCWLRLHLPSVHFDSIHITKYGIPKEQYMNTKTDILFDDNDQIRNQWGENAYTPDKIIEILKKIVTEG